MTLKLSYDCNSEQLKEQLEDKLSDYSIQLEAFHENHTKDRNKSFKLKGAWSARVCPFAILINDEGIALKAFYSEVRECTLDNIITNIERFLNDTIRN